MSNLRTGTCLRRRKSLRCLIHGGKHLDQLIHLRQLQAMVNHRLRRGDAQRPACAFQLRQAPYNSSNRCAVGMRHTGHVKNHARFVRRDHPIHLSLQPRAFRPTVDAAVHRERGHP
jgi:hypothetical protein